MNIHIYPSVFTHESRILKIVRTLRRNSVFLNITVIALWKEGLPNREVIEDGVEVIRVSPLFGGSMYGKIGKVAKVLGWYLGVLLAFRGKTITCFNCHSLPVLPLAILVKCWKRCALVYEPHELETQTVSLPDWARPMARGVEWALIRFADAVCLVNQSISQWYVNAYRLKCVWVVKNVPYRDEGAPVRTGLLRSAIGLNADAQLFLYQGGLVPGRGVELLLDVFSQVSPEKHLVFMGYGVLESLIKESALKRPNVHFIRAVPPERVKDYTVDADVGLSIIENACLSYYLCLPNKVFEYAACGVPSVVSAFPEMGRFVDESNCGWKIQPDAAALRKLIDTMTQEVIATKRANTGQASWQYCWQQEEKALLAMYQTLGLFVQQRSTAQIDLTERT